ncbi:DUF192 domain-containing protein [Candidatus Woesearchaeota archaeon]|nr:DUF192 domain-containing protein [Candidatus Woesearchaeota archaeon]
MILRNKKRNFKTKSRICYTPQSQAKGLMFSKKLEQNKSILIKFSKEKNIPIHMFFVFFPIDAVWINKDYKIVHIERNIKPFRPLINPNKPSIAVLETQKNATKNLKIGDKLTNNL